MPDTDPVLTPGSSRRSRWRLVALLVFWILSLAAAAGTGAFIHRYKDAIARRLGRVETSALLTTNLYTLALERVPVPMDGRYGGIAPLADGVLYTSRSGRMWFVDSTRSIRELNLRVPIDIASFEDDPYNASTTDQDNFAVKDLMVQSTETGIRVVSSYSHWIADRDCYALRVSSIDLSLDSLLAGASGQWTTRYESTPCRELGLLSDGQRRPTIGAGGRLAALSPDELLLTVGAFGNEGTADEPGSVQGPEGSYGKTVVIDLRTGASRILTEGHRNAQGLAIGSDGRIWLTEHAARGGDELNLLLDGRNYGFPYVSYGTAYGLMTWPPSGTPGRHEGYEKPMYAWVPSIATSQLTVVAGEPLAHWRGDLIVSSLVGRSLFRVRIEEERVIFVEPIPIGHRLRDVIETAGGELVLLAEDGFLIYLKAVDTEAIDPDLLPRERGQLVAAQCQGCHTFDDGGANGLGPNLYGIVDRRIASTAGFSYSAALRGLEGRWNEESLARYLVDPAAFAPGTTMALGSVLTERQVDDLITYLRSLQ